MYRGDYGFGSFWDQVFDATGKPAFICRSWCKLCPAPHAGGREEQAKYHRGGNWLDIEANLAGRAGRPANALGVPFLSGSMNGGKIMSLFITTKSDAIGPFAGGITMRNGSASQRRATAKTAHFAAAAQSYFAYQDMWRSSP